MFSFRSSVHRFHAIRAEQRREGLLVYLWRIWCCFQAEGTFPAKWPRPQSREERNCSLCQRFSQSRAKKLLFAPGEFRQIARASPSAGVLRRPKTSMAARFCRHRNTSALMALLDALHCQAGSALYRSDRRNRIGRKSIYYGNRTGVSTAREPES